MPSPNDLRKQAKDLFSQAEWLDSTDERLPLVLRAIELEVEADALEDESRATAVRSAERLTQQQQQPRDDSDKD
jgi:hypothetical protein